LKRLRILNATKRSLTNTVMAKTVLYFKGIECELETSLIASALISKDVEALIASKQTTSILVEN